MDNALKKLVEWLWDIISWLLDTLADDSMRALLLADLGLDSNAPAPTVDQNDIDQVTAYLNSDDPDVLAFYEVADALVHMMDAFESFIEPLITDTASARDVLYMLVQFASINLLRRNAPKIYAIARVVGFFMEKDATHELTFVDMGQFFTWRDLDSEEDADHNTNLFFLIILTIYVLQDYYEEDFLPEVLAGWDPQPGSDSLADSISERMVTFLISRPFKLTIPQVQETVDEVEAGVTVTLALIPRDHGGPGLFLSLGGQLDIEESGALGTIKIKASFPDAASLFWVGDNYQFDGDFNGRAEIEYVRGSSFAPPESEESTAEGALKPALAIPDTKGSHLAFGFIGFGVTVAADEAIVKLVLDQSALVIASDDPDSFLAGFFPSGGIRTDFNLEIGYDFIAETVFLGGSTRLEMVIPIGKSLGPLTIFHITVSLAIPEEERRLEIAARISFKLKVFGITFIVDQLGFQAALRAGENGGRLGPFDEPTFKFLWPKGLGLKIKWGKFTGAGFVFFDPENKEYAGMIDVTFGRFALKVTFLLKTGLDADPDYALLVVGSLEGLKISLFAGGLLTGFGLIFGINRTLAVKAFQEGIKHRTVGAVLFPEDPVGNAPQLLQALKTLFPPAPEQSIIGITLQAAWLNKNIVKIELGILIEYPAPTRVVLLGKVALGLPSRQYGLVQINFDVIGILDFHDKFLSVDSVLYDSRIGKYPLTGGLAVRIRWGEDRDGAAALGGLHPRFQLPEGFPKLDRLAITIGQGNNPRIRGETYLGVTSNIFHFGLKAEFYVGAGGFSLEGILAFDLLFEFNPFSFLAEIDIGVSVRYKGRTLAGLRLSGMLAGPAPWQACGKVKIKILFIKVTKRFDCNWGDESNELIEAINVWRELEIALGNSDSWSGQLPPESQAVVSLQAAPPTGELFLHPLGQLELVQHVAPLGIELDKFQNAPIDGERRFDITAVTINDGGVEDVRPVKEQFAPGQFFEIEGDEAVTRPSFETFTAGIRVGSGAITHGAAVDAEFDYEEIVVNEETSRPSYRDLYQINSAMVLAGAEYGLMAQAVNGVRGRYHGPRHQIKRNQPGYLAVTVAGLAEVALSDPPAAGASYTEVKQAIERHLAQHPGARDKIQIVREHERRTP